MKKKERNLVLSLLIIFGSFVTICAQLKPLTEEEIEQLNSYNSLEEALQNPDKVEALFLNYAHLDEIPNEVTQFKNMIVLGLGGNNISEIPDFVFELEKLQHFGFSHNNVSVILMVFQN